MKTNSGADAPGGRPLPGRIGTRLRERAKSLNSDIPALFAAMKDRETPFFAKFFAVLAVCYALSPIDLIPDFIPVAGYLDDLLIVPALAALAVRFIPPGVWRRCKESSAALRQDGRMKKWYYALPIAAVWLAVILLVLRAVFG